MRPRFVAKPGVEAMERAREHEALLTGEIERSRLRGA
jgi:hypothetical protein